jgi:hypothetical protein
VIGEAPEKLMFVHLPKTGGWSVKEALSRATPDYFCLKHRGKMHNPLPIRMKKGSGNYPNLKVFTVMRNPFTRAMSAYNYLRYGAARHRARDKRDFEEHLSEYENFEDFVHSGGLLKASKELVHFRTQCFWLRENNEEGEENYWDICQNIRILKYERMRKAVHRFIKRNTGKRVFLKRLNVTKYTPAVVNRQLLKQKVLDIYAQDFSVWKNL